MEIIYSPTAKNDLEYWRKSGNKSIQKKISALLVSIIETPFEGIGWSRRIDREHRIVYELSGNIVNIYAFKGHYQ